MLNFFGPNPRNRIYTSLNSYSLFLGYILGGRFWENKKGVTLFEKELRERFQTQYAKCVYQCRLGIYLSLKALIKPGQEVILSPYTLIDVVNMVIYAGGRPVFADVDRETCNISVNEVQRLIHANTGAVLITHLHGVTAEAHRIKEICDRFNVPMVEDCAQAFGAQEQGKDVGTIGDAGIFSFEMHKNLTTWLGGAVITNRDDVAEKISAELKEFSYPPLPGIIKKVKKGLIHEIANIPGLFQLLTYPIVRYSYLNEFEFINKRVRRKPQESKEVHLPDSYKSWFTSFQGYLGASRLKKVNGDIKVRIENAMLYYEGLKDIKELSLPPVRSEAFDTYLWFPVQYSKRDELIRSLFQQGRDIAVAHFTNTADNPRFQEYASDCPNARLVEKELFFLPTYPRYSRGEVEKTIRAIRQHFGYSAVAESKVEEVTLVAQ